jgi:hypothetical protein
MWKSIGVFGALMVLLAIGVASALPAGALPECTDCYANIITQDDTQIIDTVKIGLSDAEVDDVGIGNEGLSAAIIVAAPPVDPEEGSMFAAAPFARIDQSMYQVVSNLGTRLQENGEEGAKGLTWNKAIQAAWIANQGVKELEEVDGVLTWVKEGAYISQSTNQTINNVYDYDSREFSKVLNCDNKLAMIVDDLDTIINITATADSATTDSESSYGEINNTVNLTVSARDPH